MPKGLGDQVVEEMLREPDPKTRTYNSVGIDDSSLYEILKREGLSAHAEMCLQLRRSASEGTGRYHTFQ